MKKILLILSSIIGLAILLFLARFLWLVYDVDTCSAHKPTVEPKNIFGEAKKPVIYLYPEDKQDIYVQLNYKGKLIVTYPKYDESIKGWEVEAYPDGKIINKKDNLEYSYLFWEGVPKHKIAYDLSTGFIVRGKDTVAFLREKLSFLGLTPKEYNEFIVYWYPLMKDNPYNVIHFAQKNYTDSAMLYIEPKPDSILRIFMVYKSINTPINIIPQALESFHREGFSVIEWGGSEL